MRTLLLISNLAVVCNGFSSSPVTGFSEDVTCEALTTSSLLQRKHIRSSAKPTAYRSRSEIEEEPLHPGEDCWEPCGGKGGYCSWCGEGNACCRFGMEAEDKGCASAQLSASIENHQCVKVERAVTDRDDEFYRQIAAKKAELGIAEGEQHTPGDCTACEQNAEQADTSDEKAEEASQENLESEESVAEDSSAVAEISEDSPAPELSQEEKIAAVKASVDAALKMARETESISDKGANAEESAAERAWRESAEAKQSTVKRGRRKAEAGNKLSKAMMKKSATRW